MDAVKRKSPEKTENHNLVSLSQPCSSASVGLVKDFFFSEEHCSILHILLTWLQLTFTRFLYRNQR
jgi:hypothetical protein